MYAYNKNRVVEQELELQVEPTSVKEMLLTFLHEQDKPWCISPKILEFYFKSPLYNKLDCALGL
jgi:hypothetical protein